MLGLPLFMVNIMQFHSCMQIRILRILSYVDRNTAYLVTNDSSPSNCSLGSCQVREERTLYPFHLRFVDAPGMSLQVKTTSHSHSLTNCFLKEKNQSNVEELSKTGRTLEGEADFRDHGTASECRASRSASLGVV